MNERTEMMNDAVPASTGSIAATVLRLLGAGVTVFGALVFMLQGFEHIELAWRPWFYPAFIALLGAGGATSLYLFRDARGARLFLGLAVALVPVQFSQLGGMLHELLYGQVGAVPGVFRSGPGSLELIAAVAAVSALVLPAASWAGFRILVRRYAMPLCVTFLAVSALLLLPARASWPGLFLIGALAGTFLWLERRRFRSAPEFATWEGWAVRCMFLLPLGIATVRAAFYMHELSMFAALFGVAGALLLLVIRAAFPTWIAEGMRALAGACLALAWLLLAVDIFSLSYDYLWFAAVFPIGLVLLVIGHFAPRSGRVYRGFGIGLTALASYALLDASNGIPAWLTVCAIGAGACFMGAYYRERSTVFVGAVQTMVSLFGVVVLALRALEADTWLVLAVAGMALVLLSSVAERYGFGLSRIRRFTLREPQDG